MRYYGGVEGGATRSTLVLINAEGRCLAQVNGEGTNVWLIGKKECAKRLFEMVQLAKSEAGLSNNTRLTTLGLSLSGCSEAKIQSDLEKEIRFSFPSMADHYVLNDDTYGSIYTMSPVGGMVAIAGTGSNTMLMNPDEKCINCGGWGHILGDEGSGFHIALRSIKIVYDDMDNREKAPFSCNHVWKAICDHFSIKDRFDILPHIYKKFDKAFISSLTKRLSVLATTQHDPLAEYIFKEAGVNIARNIKSLLPKVHEDLVKDGDMNVVCVGSVWLSWGLMKKGFLSVFQEPQTTSMPFGLKLLRLTKPAAYGACYRAADLHENYFPRNYHENCEILFHLKAFKGQ